MFYLILVFSIFLISFVIVNHFQVIVQYFKVPLISHAFIIFFLFQLASIFHELGHATACKKHGATPGVIGFGFYYLIPVLFSDVSDAWKLPANKRIIVNLGGFYFEIIVGTISTIIYLITANEIFLLFPCVMLLDTLHNFNPLLKFDGYWILSDLLKIPNLHLTANKTFLAFIKGKQVYLSTHKKWLLIIFELLSKSYIIFIILSIAVFKHNDIIYFPVNLFRLVTGELNFEFITISELILPIIFYYLFIKHIITKLPYLFKSFLRKIRTY